MNTDMLLNLVMALSLVGALIAAAIFAFHFLRRSKFGKQMGLPTPRQRRVNLIERAHLDNGRKLLLVRRDDVEHLVMIGGPIDVLVETGIQRPRIPYARSTDRDALDGINNRHHTDWGLHREPPPPSVCALARQDAPKSRAVVKRRLRAMGAPSTTDD